jgi:hypothetical protein
MGNKTLTLRSLTKKWLEEKIYTDSVQFVREVKNRMKVNNQVNRNWVCNQYAQLKMVATDLNLDIDTFIIMADPTGWADFESIIGVLGD